jgi:hypothetical protein
MTSPSDDEDEIPIDTDEMYEDVDVGEFIMTREECQAVMKELRNAWISYENPIARKVIAKMLAFADDNLK